MAASQSFLVDFHRDRAGITERVHRYVRDAVHLHAVMPVPIRRFTA